MNRLVPLVVAFLFAGVLGCAASNPLVGTWALVTTENSSPDSTPAPGVPLKMLNDSHFAFGFMVPGGDVYAGGGRYAYRSGIYTETIAYHSDPFLVGRSLDFKFVLKDGTWYHTGTFDIEGRRYEVNEIWKRVKE